MANHPPTELDTLRAEIAAAAARMIAEDGADYGSAKRKAARQILGDVKPAAQILPDNEQIEQEVRLYNELFLADTQPVRLAHLRRTALELMRELAPFDPYLTGAVLNGTAGVHSDIHLHLFVDSPKDVEMFLLNRDTRFEVSENGEPGGTVEVLSFMHRGEGVHLTLLEPKDLRRSGGSRRAERADLEAVRALIAEGESA